MTHLRFAPKGMVLLGLWLLGCDSAPPTTAGMGGQLTVFGGTIAGTTIGGSQAGGAGAQTGGSGILAGGARTGGGVNTGGAVSASGGAITTGGAMAGGVAATGGAVVTRGGATATTGGARTGGTVTATGGTATAGGAVARGGVPAAGGIATTGGVTSTGGASSLPKFSFFVISFKTIKKLSNSANGFGGDLRFGETGAGAGLRGADKICAAAADEGLPGASAKRWRAFLSATADETGKQVNAIDRIGEGPWYDRLGRLFANKKSELLFDRPQNADPVIKNDFPNEFGVTNHNPDLTGEVDNHDMLTGSNASGTLYSASATCKDWTTSDGSAANGKPRVGHSWPRNTGGGRAGGGSMANWMSALDEAGCAAGVNLIEQGGPKNDGTVGSGGGYGGFYCFALEP